MDKLIQVEILTPENIVYRGKVKSITLPGIMGSFQVLYNHAPLISLLEIGKIKIIDGNGNMLYFVVSDGFAEVRNNVVTVLVDSAEQFEKAQIDKVVKERKRKMMISGFVASDVKDRTYF
ncbi:F-type H+-transporting ATPase subunit epsilon [Candidatus Kryptobacter tengchongensis]|uniref:ATP synthase epsilon chain n=1 Tax=Kryptobacter tengchongensis TaxID=1643429 RepID=A0A656D0X6_KRYT1|nr:ATP synthase F1 subunit epsilon [Candidatus Kryptobacter tengchongensis]CUS93703.1 F-type H+-transporting ATPase subunit epsilon [Candidatus Kryptobacter tengchongensis]CUS95918.1 F-type H+-transporting ATPase subunit epsilon [Candidatus Kryptobacter tengchongensis]CUU02198.1 F-type H+-transporting ATPase subunit epsilon [Candidatus Kryptobacter tengchongensis]